MNKLYQVVLEHMMMEAENGIYDDDEDIVSVLSNGESDRVVLHDDCEDDDDEDDEEDDDEWL